MTHYLCEIDYINRDGDSVHSDIPVVIDEAVQVNKRDMLVYLVEVIESANWEKPWSLKCHGPCDF